jgi:hypothetical protein
VASMSTVKSITSFIMVKVKATYFLFHFLDLRKYEKASTGVHASSFVRVSLLECARVGALRTVERNRKFWRGNSSLLSPHSLLLYYMILSTRESVETSSTPVLFYVLSTCKFFNTPCSSLLVLSSVPNYSTYFLHVLG